MGYTRTVIKRCGPDGRCRDGEDEDTQRGEHGALGRHVIVAMVTEIRMAFLTTVAKSLLLQRSLVLENERRRVGYHRLGSIAKMALDGKELSYTISQLQS